MPRTGTPKGSVTFRITPAARKWIADQARKRGEHGITDGEMVRWMLTYASIHMPGDYRPAGVTPEKRRPGT